MVDVGSGAGLPGLVLALRRPDLTVQLLEPLLRRTRFLEEAVDDLGLGAQVGVVRGRAEDREVVSTVGGADVVVSRAVAPLDRLARWCLPLVRAQGVMLALKGGSAADEVRDHGIAVERAGGRGATVVRCGSEWLDPPTLVIRIEKADGAAPAQTTRSRRGRR